MEIEYGHEMAVNSKMCLKYISFENSFLVTDTSDNNFFKICEIRWRQNWWPLCRCPLTPGYDNYGFFQQEDRSCFRTAKWKIMTLTIGERKAKITSIKVDGVNLVYDNQR